MNTSIASPSAARPATATLAHDAPDPRRWKALAVLCAAYFMVILDSQIVILALPSIERALGFSPGHVQWVMSVYLLSFGGLLLLGGRMADLLGRRRMFMLGTGLFLVASLGCGLAASPRALIVARVLQGAAAAVMSPSALSILMTTFSEGSERNKALGIWSGMGGVGATSALLVGGPLADVLGWPWIFYINVPVAGAVILLCPMLLRESRADERTHPRRYDPAGALTITAGLMLLVYAFVEAPAAGWLGAQTLGVFAGAVALIALFVLIEARSAAPLVPLSIFRSRTLVGGNLLMLVLGMTAWGVGTTVSLYAQKVLGYSALQFGLGTAVLTVMAVVGSTFGQGFVTRVGFRRVAMAAMLLLGAASLLLSRIRLNGTYFGDIFLGLFIFGAGLGACAVAGSIAALSGVGKSEAGLASGINTAAFQLGGAFGAAAVATVAVSFAAVQSVPALHRGYQASFIACAVFAMAGLLVAWRLLRRPPMQRA
ncbi:MFS transporter [Variovorax sp. EL159]|uniref:MFS transporter n=1 Tax=Variovorax sp. EL159 TaxID=1566270 RepID=UPI000884E8CE|nr:MFS transporter [Variovorax sp. EL159]SCX72844.1 drug resistance transporter, EmrB/QacA subfamily [Variovorax sp. EL159]